MKDAPGNKCPIGSVPESTYQEDNKGVPDSLPFAPPTSSQGHIQIIAEPSGKRDMPASPEFRDIAGKIGKGKIPHQTKSKQSSRSDCDIGVAGKVSVNLKAKENSSKQQCTAAQPGAVGKCRIDKDSACISDNHLFEKSPKYLAEPINGLAIVEDAA